MKQSIIKLLIIGIFCLLISMVYLCGINNYLDFTLLKMHKQQLLEIVQQHYLISGIIYTVLYCILVALALPAAGILTLAGGALFGVVATVVYVCIGATAGAVIAFLTARYVMRDLIEYWYGAYIVKLNAAINKYGYNYMLVLRLVPIMPFFIINPLAGLTQLPLSTFIWTTIVGIIPGTIAFSAAGERIAHLSSIQDVLSWQTIGVLCLLAAVAMIPILVQSVVNYRTK